MWRYSEYLPPVLAFILEIMCQEVPAPPSPAITISSDSESLFLSGSVNFTCPPSMATTALASLQVLTCTENSGTFGFLPQQVEPCTVCAAEPEVRNASTTWVNSTSWQLDSTVTATCDDDHLVAIGDTDFVITCNETGWQHEAACYEEGDLPPPSGCVAEPPVPGDNMTRDAVEWAGVGAVLQYNCSPGHYIPPSEAGAAPLAWTTVTCMANHTWTPAGPVLSCYRRELWISLGLRHRKKFRRAGNFLVKGEFLCLETPPAADLPGNSSWDGVTSVVGTQFELSCPPDFFFSDLNTSVSVECGEDEQWTAVEAALLRCRRVCSSSLPPEPTDAILVVDEPPYWEGATAAYVCPQGMLSKEGQRSASVDCGSDGWTQLDPTFACFNSCLSQPPEGPARVSNNYTGGRVEGTLVEYTCLAGFYDPGSASPPTSVTSICEEGRWTLDKLPYCGGKSDHALRAWPYEYSISLEKNFYKAEIEDSFERLCVVGKLVRFAA
ncbi:complement factor H-related protein 4-like [Penaeus monodon]|uniref:complement factor H-related protein 4-like n=1 Tax=Penaeus monodon TaxID=6687 RepID=UPI0018A74653|nr:complement factor H-related protein 4-like [Penaeus monodon]